MYMYSLLTTVYSNKAPASKHAAAWTAAASRTQQHQLSLRDLRLGVRCCSTAGLGHWWLAS